MARLVSGTAVQFEDLKALQLMLLDFPMATRQKYMKAAFNAAAKVGVQTLKQITPRGPTGNLKRAVTSKATRGYGIAGYATGKGPAAQGFHQGFLEFGTKPRKTKKRFASTFNSKSKGRGGKMTIVTARRGRSAGMMKTKSPAFPKSFFKSASIGNKVDLKRMPIGGRTGQPPVKTAFERSKGGITTVLSKQAATAYERAMKDLARKFPPKATT